ncbi:hypothetical protein BH11MYX4_BH11MYX4_15790 [soil metagenome]
MARPHAPRDVMPAPVAKALDDTRYWFVIGGQAVRCFCPYRPSDDVDFGVANARDAASLLAQLRRRGRVEILERAPDTVHLTLDGVPVSIFVLSQVAPHTEAGALNVTGILATKLHAILDRGTRRDFFDLYVLLQQQRLGVIECVRALRTVFPGDINEGLLLRALAYFDDAEREAPLPHEGATDWRRVKAFFQKSVGALLVPPAAPLEIQSLVVDVRALQKVARGRRARATGTKTSAARPTKKRR